jgi:hypothetical protein
LAALVRHHPLQERRLPEQAAVVAAMPLVALEAVELMAVRVLLTRAAAVVVPWDQPAEPVVPA